MVLTPHVVEFGAVTFARHWRKHLLLIHLNLQKNNTPRGVLGIPNRIIFGMCQHHFYPIDEETS